jgi:hypothetical protein
LSNTGFPTGADRKAVINRAFLSAPVGFET